MAVPRISPSDAKNAYPSVQSQVADEVDALLAITDGLDSVGDGLLVARSDGTWAGFDPNTLHSGTGIENVKEQHGAVGDGITNDTAALQAAVDAAGGTGLVFLPRGEYLFTGLSVMDGTRLIGTGSLNTILRYTGTGNGIVQSTPGTRIFAVNMQGIRLDNTNDGVIGLNLDSVSISNFYDVQLTGWDVGCRVHSPINGGSVYNTFFACNANLCVNGWEILASGSNENRWIASRANACSNIGFRVVDSNHTSLLVCAIEGCANGVVLESTSVGLTNLTTAIGTRFESNTVAWNIGANCTQTVDVVNYYDSSSGTRVDNGTRTLVARTDGLSMSTPQQQDAVRFTRTANGGELFPFFVVRDAVSSAGTPVTQQIEMERLTGFFQRFRRADTTRAQVTGEGEWECATNDRGVIMRSPNGTRWRVKIDDTGTIQTQSL